MHGEQLTLMRTAADDDDDERLVRHGCMNSWPTSTRLASKQHAPVSVVFVLNTVKTSYHVACVSYSVCLVKMCVVDVCDNLPAEVYFGNLNI